MKRIYTAILLALLAVLIAVPVMASEPQPTAMEIREIVAYQNCKEDGDQLYILTYYVTINSTQNINQLFFFRLMDEDLELDSTSAFPFHDQGYGMGIVAFYFGADDAPTWEGNITAQIIGNPTVDWDGDLPSTSNDIIIWDTSTTMAETQSAVSAKILYLGTELGQSWDEELVTTAQGVMTLTSTGAAYFLTVIPYCGEIVPYIFGTYIFEPDYPIDPKPPSDDYADSLIDAIEGTIFDISPTAESWGMDTGVLTAVFWYIAAVGFVIALIMKKGLKKGAMLIVWPFVVAGSFFGVPLAVAITASFFWLVAGVWVFYKGAT